MMNSIESRFKQIIFCKIIADNHNLHKKFVNTIRKASISSYINERRIVRDNMGHFKPWMELLSPPTMTWVTQ